MINSKNQKKNSLYPRDKSNNSINYKFLSQLIFINNFDILYKYNYFYFFIF